MGPGRAPVKRVVNCLGAMPDNQMPPGGDATWHKVFDTNSALNTVLAEERKTWRANATLHKGAIETSFVATIPEYVTAPFDERSDKSYVSPAKWPLISSAHTVYALQDMATAIDAIAKEITALRATPADFGNVQIGVPAPQDWVAAAQYFGIAKAEELAAASRDRVTDLVKNDRNYVQATVGILPENITSFLDRAANQKNFNESDKNMPVSAADPATHKGLEMLPYRLVGTAMGMVDKKVHKLVEALTVTKGSAVAQPDHAKEDDVKEIEIAPLLSAAEDGPLPTDKLAEKVALEGVLRLILYVTTGNMLWYSRKTIGGIDKNMVSFLPKTPLNAAVQALPYDVSPARLRTVIFPGRFNSVLAGVYAVHLEIGEQMQMLLGKEYPLSQDEVEGKGKSSLGTSSVRDYLSNVLSGSSDSAHAGWAKETLGPEKPERGGREGIATRNWFWQNQRTHALVFEMRHAIAKIPATQLRQFATNIVKLVRGAHG